MRRSRDGWLGHATNVGAEQVHVDVALYPEGVTTTVIIDGDSST